MKTVTLTLNVVLSVLYLFLLPVTGIGQAPPPPVLDAKTQAEALNTQGKAAYDAEKYADAVALFQKAITLDPGEVAYVTNLAGSLRHAERYEEAQTLLTSTLPAFPKPDDQNTLQVTLADVHFYWGQSFVRLKKDDDAVLHFQAAAAIDRTRRPSDAGYDLDNNGGTLLRLRHFREAAEAYREALTIQQALKDISGQRSVLPGLGKAYQALGRNQEAVEAYEGALTLLPLSGWESRVLVLDGLAECYGRLGQTVKAQDAHRRSSALTEADALNTRGVAASKAKHYAEAAALSRQAMTLNPASRVYVINLARNECSQGQYAQAVALLEAKLSLFPETEAQTEMQNEIADAHFGWGKLLEKQKRTAEAIPHYMTAYALDAKWHPTDAPYSLRRAADAQGALFHFEEAQTLSGQEAALYHALGDAQGEASALNNQAAFQIDLNHYPEALDYLQQALPLRRQVGDRKGEARTLGELGVAYDDLSQYAKAIDYYQQALLIKREIKDRAGEAVTLNNLGAAYSHLSQYAKAVDFYQQALLIKREVKDRAGEAATLNNLGTAYSHLSQYAKAIDYQQQALLIKREVKDRAGEAVALGNLGTAYRHLSQYAKAIEYHQQALLLFQEIKDRAGEAATLGNLGVAYDDLSQYAKAVDFYQQALLIRREVKDRAGEAVTLGNLGVAYDDLSQHAKAIDYFQQALLIQREVKDRAGEAGTLGNLMLSWNTLHTPRLAIWYGKQAVNVRQSIRQDVQGLDKETQKTYLAANETSYRTLAALLLSQGRLPEAEQVLGMLKEQEFFNFVQRDATVAPAATLTRPTPEEAALEQRYTQIADQVTALGAERGALVEKDKDNTLTPAEKARLDSLEKDLAAANQHFQTFFAQLQSQLTGTAVAKTAADLGDAEGLQTALKTLGEGAVALYTLETADRYYVLLVTPDAQKVEQFAIPKEQVDRKITLFRQALRDPTRDPRLLAQELYTILFCNGALARDLAGAGAKTLLWSLDGSLGYLPMAALYDGKQYLVEKYRTVVFTPVSKANLTLPVSPTWKGLGLGVSKAHQVVGDAGQAPDNFQALPGAAAELRGIIGDGGDQTAGETAAAKMPGTIQMDDAFTEDALRTGLHRQYPLVHIASHFQFSPGDDTHSYLLLGDGRTLTAADMKRMPGGFTGVQLLTLSACSTAMGGVGADGTEVEGFATLVQKKGAAAVLASLWEVSDDSTSLLMQRFYRLREAGPGATKAEALRQAQIELLTGKMSAPALPSQTNRAKRAKVAGAASMDLPLFATDPKAPYAHPYYWAPFVLIGNPQ